MTLIDDLKAVNDPRSYHGREYRLHHILLFTILAILANAKTYTDVASFIKVHYDRLKDIFGLKWHQIPDVSAIRKIKDHEIGAFQQFLLDLNLKDVVVTADAIHCQKKHLNAPLSVEPN